MNRKNQVLATSLSLLLSVGMTGGSILPVFAMENEGNTEIQTDVATEGNAEQSENGAQSQKETTPEAKKISKQAAETPSSKSVKANSADEEEGKGEEDTASKGVAVDEKNFPDEGFRKYVSAWFDLDQDGYLSDEEIEKATTVRITYSGYDYDEDDYPPLYTDSTYTEYWKILNSINNVEGIEHLSKLKKIDINLSYVKNMKTLDLSSNTELESVEIGPTCSDGDDPDGLYNDTFESIDVSNCKKLESLNIYKCDNLREIKLHQNVNLMDLNVEKSLWHTETGAMDSIDLTQCPNLKSFSSDLNSIRTLDFSQCSQLETLNLHCPKVASINLKENAELTKVNISNSGVTEMNLSGATKLQSFVNNNEWCENGNAAPLQSVDFSDCSDLEEIDLSESPIKNIDVSNNGKLVSLYVSGTKISSLDVSKAQNLENLSLSGTDITSIDVSHNPELVWLEITGTGIGKLNLSQNTNLENLNVSDTQLETIDVSSNLNLEELDTSETDIKSLNVSKNLRLKGLDVSKSKIASLDVSQNLELERLNISNTDIKKLDISKNKKLYDLNLSNTSIENMKNADFSENPDLAHLTLDNAGIESIKFGKMGDLYGLSDLSVKGNHLLEANLENLELDEFEKEYVDFNADNQTPIITLEPDQIKNNTVALSDLFSDVSRVTIEKGEGYTYDADAKTITFQDKKNRKFKYTWDTKLFDDGSALLKGTATIQVPNEPEEKPNPKPEVKYDTLTKIKLGTTRYTYDGKVKKPSVSAYIGSTRADASKYKVTYPTGMKNIGSYTVKVTGNQSKFCKGTLTATYRIDPKKVKTPSSKAGKKKVTVKWTKVSGGVKYQMAIAKKGGKYKTYAVSGNSKTVKKLTSKKKYTVKVRAYKKVGSKTYYGDWSKPKTVKVK